MSSLIFHNSLAALPSSGSQQLFPEAGPHSTPAPLYIVHAAGPSAPHASSLAFTEARNLEQVPWVEREAPFSMGIGLAESHQAPPSLDEEPIKGGIKVGRIPVPRLPSCVTLSE